VTEPGAGRAAASSPARGSRRTGAVVALVLAGGAAASLGLALAAPPGAADPLRGVVMALPLVVAMLAAAGIGMPRTDRAAALEATLLAAWLGAALARPVLGIPAAERPLAVAVFLLVAAHVVRRLASLAASPDLGEPSRERAIAGRLFLLALALYTTFLPWATAARQPDGDEPWYLLTAHSLVQDGDTDLADEYRDRESLRFLDRPLGPQPGDPRGPRGEIYSRHDPLLPLLLAPFYAAAGKHGALFAMALLAAATTAAWWPLARAVWPAHPRAGLVQWAVLALCPPFLLYSHQLWVEVPAALLVLTGVLMLERLRRTPTPAAWLLLASALVALPALKLRFGVLSASMLGLAFLVLPRQRRRLAAVTVLCALAGAVVLLHNRQLFGNALRIHEWQELLLYRYPARWYLAHLVGLFFDVAFGLFAAAPIWLLLVPGAATKTRSPGAFGRWRDLALLCLPYLVLVASRREWFGGWSPPFRYPLALLPLLALLAVPAWSSARSPAARAIVAALALATLATTLVYVAAPGLAYNFADGRSRALDFWSRRLELDLAALVPSGVRVRDATWWVPLAVVGVLVALWPRAAAAAGSGRPPAARPQRGAALHAPSAGALGLLAVALALPAIAATTTTRRVDLESPHVEKSGGHPDPDPWMFDRRRFPEAWVLPEGESARARVRAGGDLVELRIAARPIVNHPGRLELHLACGNRLLARIRFDAGDAWEERAAGPVPWTPGCPLVVSVPGDLSRPAGVSSGVAVDRVELRWRPPARSTLPR
jgi:hypothetical protein